MFFSSLHMKRIIKNKQKHFFLILLILKQQLNNTTLKFLLNAEEFKILEIAKHQQT